LVGTKEQVVDGLELLVNEVGLDGVVLSWADYRAGMIRFRDEVMPLLKQAGLR
jgi:alkanesulfonate monooxygenase SsuD/methylene tetrahydromethanopterin reductase-like flavin-dependent oxidoreductase (luciferase family)